MASNGLISPIAFILQAFTQAGVVGAGYQIAIYQGGTTTPATTYTSSSLAVANSNPLVLDASGRLQTSVWAPPGTTLKMVLEDNLGNVIPNGTIDNLPMINDISTSLYPQTSAEQTAGVNPSNFLYPEGDIRRYGASTTAVDNSTAINDALAVSSAGGSAAYVAPGTYQTENPCVAPPGSSMYGAGATNSVINPINGVDGLQLTTADVTYGGRTFRDFKILGTLSGTTNSAHGIYASVGSGFLLNLLFSNVAVITFEYGVYMQNVEDSTVFSCLIQNCWYGVYFNNQSANICLTDNTINLVSPSTVITGPNNSVGVTVTGSPELEGLHIKGGSNYGYNYTYNMTLVFEVQITSVDISNNSICPIYFSSTLGGFAIRDCWIELGPSSSGSFNYSGSAYGNGNLCGIFVTAITQSSYGHIKIEGNYIVSDNQISGSVGIFLGAGNAGTTINSNAIEDFDIGISGGATASTIPTNGTSGIGCFYKFNRINLFNASNLSSVYSSTSSTIILNSAASDCEVGPNQIVQGVGQAATIAASANITVTAASAFPVGTPVQATTNLSGGPVVGVTYWVISASGTTVTIGAVAGGAAIAWTGTGSIGNLVQAPVPVKFNTGATPVGTSLFARGGFVLTLSDPALSTTCLYNASGRIVSLVPVTAMTGAAGATTMTATGLPAFLWPTTTQNFVAGVENNSVAGYGMGQASSAGALSFFATPAAGAFTNAGNKGLYNQNLTYTYS